VDNHTKKHILNKVCQSSEFTNSQKLRELLSYLVNASLCGDTPKEMTIAFDFFGKTKDFDPVTDSYVRSNIYKLRKKLKDYYAGEGRTDHVRMTIPKGQYHVEFTKSKNSFLKRPKSIIAIVLVFLLFTVLNVYLIYQHNESKDSASASRAATHPFWSDFLQSDLHTFLVIGDIILYGDYDRQRDKLNIILDRDINSFADFEALKKEHPQKDLRALNFSHIHMSTVPNLISFMPIFSTQPEKIKHEWSTKLTWDDLTNNNIIYIGNVRSLHILRMFFQPNNHMGSFIVRQVDDLIQIDSNSDTVEVYKTFITEDYSESYALISKYPGPQGNSILFFLGTEYPARVLIFDKYSQPEFLKQIDRHFQRKHGIEPRFFEILFKITGYERYGFDYEIIHSKPFSPKDQTLNFKSQK